MHANHHWDNEAEARFSGSGLACRRLGHSLLRYRALHILVEAVSCPAYFLAQSLDAAPSLYSSLNEWERFGIIRSFGE